MKYNLRCASGSTRVRPLLAIAALASLASLSVRADISATKPVTPRAALSECTLHE